MQSRREKMPREYYHEEVPKSTAFDLPEARTSDALQVLEPKKALDWSDVKPPPLVVRTGRTSLCVG